MKKNINPEVFMNFFKLIAKISVLASLIAVCAHAGQNGNGGGGINRNGMYMTFYSAGFYTEVVDLTVEQVPQLTSLIKFIKDNPYLAASKKTGLIAAMMPAPSRKYFKVNASSFTPEVRKRLLAEYGRVMKVDVNEVTLFAITDTESKNTYLFPEFFRLNAIEQMAILFHEAYWLINPKASYEEVVVAEMSFQSYLENPQSADQLLRWITSMGNSGDIVIGSLAGDIGRGYLDGLVVNKEVVVNLENETCESNKNSEDKMSERKSKKSKAKSKESQRGKADSKESENKTNCEASSEIKSTRIIKLADLFGQNFFECRKSGYTSECIIHIQTNLYELTQKYPNSLFLKILLDKINTGKMAILYHENRENYLHDRIDEYSKSRENEIWDYLSNREIKIEMVMSGAPSKILIPELAVQLSFY